MPTKKPAEALNLQPPSAGFLHGFLFDPENEGDIFPLKGRSITKVHSVTAHKTVFFML
jgi:hypothetical protein